MDRQSSRSGKGRTRLHARLARHRLIIGLAFITLLLFACGEDQSDEPDESPGVAEVVPAVEPPGVLRIDDLVARIRSGDHAALRGQAIEIEAYISPPPKSADSPGTPPQGCPVVPEKQAWLTDDPAVTQIEVAGAELPNRLDGEKPILRLVVPYTIGFIDIPERARLRGYVLDEAHEGCPQFRSLFVLEEILEELPSERVDAESDHGEDWLTWSHDPSGLIIEYPPDWEVEERDTGVHVQVRFVGPDPFRSIRVDVQEGETFWHPDASSGTAPPGPLRGDRHELATAGQARARLVDDSTRTAIGERELRLVFNHQGNTIFLAMIFQDGTSLEQESISVFSEMARRLRLRGDITISDPMDPILAASDELGDGPFLSEDDARYVAVSVSGMIGAQAIEAELVSEREARTAVAGACRDFDGGPAGIWLITVEGTLPTGQEAHRLVYLSATNGVKLCQAEAPGVS